MSGTSIIAQIFVPLKDLNFYTLKSSISRFMRVISDLTNKGHINFNISLD